MQEGPIDNGGLEGGAELPKGRQRVRRHWKPSLGKFVDMYRRKGEHAQPKAPGEAGADADVQVTSPGASKQRRRLLVGGGALGLVVVVIAAWCLFGRAHETITIEVRAAREPLILKLDCGPASRAILGSKAEKDKCLADANRMVLDATRAHPDQLVVIDMKSPPLRFKSLSKSDQTEMNRSFGTSAGHSYESKVAQLLERIVEASAPGQVSVLGLPIEPREIGFGASEHTNDRYNGVIDRLNCLVSAHVFYRGDLAVSEEQLVQETLPEALQRRGSRPVVFRQDRVWRVVVDRGATDPQMDAARRLVVAEAE